MGPHPKKKNPSKKFLVFFFQFDFFLLFLFLFLGIVVQGGDFLHQISCQVANVDFRESLQVVIRAKLPRALQRGLRRREPLHRRDPVVVVADDVHHFFGTDDHVQRMLLLDARADARGDSKRGARSDDADVHDNCCVGERHSFFVKKI
jgi:hypothetical protein